MIELKTITELAALEAMAGSWRELATSGGVGGLFRGPDWILPWWHAYRRVLAAELFVLCGYEGEQLVVMAPFYRRVGRLGPGLKVREIRMLGDAGPRPPALDILVVPGFEEAAGSALARALKESANDWDLLDLEPMQDPSRVRAYFANRLDSAGHTVASTETGGAQRIALTVAGIDVASEDADLRASAYVDDRAALRKGLAALRRLSRLEWADREEASPLADAEATQLLEEVTLALGTAGKARLARLDDVDGEAVAAALVVDDDDRAVVLALAVDVEHKGAAARLLTAEARAAAMRNCVALDVVTGAGEYELPALPISRQRALRVRVYGSSSAAAVARTYGAVRRRVEAARDVPGSAAAGARAAWTKIRTAAGNVAGYQRLHLYRGELWTRGFEHTHGLTLDVFTEANFDALERSVQELLVNSLELDVDYCRTKWQRGDLVVLARLSDRPAGVAWSATGKVPAPEIDRTLTFGPGEAYIHDVFVASQARGRNIAPSMLEFLAHELRQRDVYRSWALIGNENLASVRAFEKASYVAVADVIYARMAKVDKLVIRPPDPEAKRVLGL